MKILLKPSIDYYFQKKQEVNESSITPKYVDNSPK